MIRPASRRIPVGTLGAGAQGPIRGGILAESCPNVWSRGCLFPFILESATEQGADVRLSQEAVTARKAG